MERVIAKKRPWSKIELENQTVRKNLASFSKGLGRISVVWSEMIKKF